MIQMEPFQFSFFIPGNLKSKSNRFFENLSPSFLSNLCVESTNTALHAFANIISVQMCLEVRVYGITVYKKIQEGRTNGNSWMIARHESVFRIRG